ncbi:MAG: hypothetical protein HUJ89_06240 [Bacteroidales bacterium]|nr:hypothetical protein [Bacteroidales bacterium]
MGETVNIPEIRAEFLLNTLFPERRGQWIARYDGTFYRNYNRDAMQVNEKTGEVSLSRDGLFALLPEGMVTSENALRTKDYKGTWQEMSRRVQVLKEACVPIDTFLFRESMIIENRLQENMDIYWDAFVQAIFDVDVQGIENPLIRNFARMLPFVEELRGDYRAIAKLLGYMLDRPVSLKDSVYSMDEAVGNIYPELIFRVEAPGLDEEQFRELYELVHPLQDFIKEYYVDFNVRFSIEIRDTREAGATEKDEKLIDYNIWI